LTTRPIGEATAATNWGDAWRLVADARWYWLATLHPTGAPQVRPVLAVELDGTLHFCSSPSARKGRNLARDARCTLTTELADLHAVLEGRASRVTDEHQLQRLAEAYAAKYDWPVTVREGAFTAAYGAPTAGPPPYQVYRFDAVTGFGFPTGTEDPAVPITPTRWDF